MKFKTKLAGTLAAVAMISGAVPLALAPAHAIELGQHLDHGPKWPHKSIHFVTLGLGIAALVTAIVLVTDNDDEPVSP